MNVAANHSWFPGYQLFRFLVNTNPFYILSAVLVLFGLHRCTAGEDGLQPGFLLLGLLAGYTLLLAFVCWTIVKIGKVWQDARTLFLLLVVMFGALSVVFDQTCQTAPSQGAIYLAAGFLVVISITEGLLTGLKMALPLRFRLPWYVCLAVFFAYPPLLGQLSLNCAEGLSMEGVQWGIFAFPFVAALGLLTLLPAAAMGPQGKQNGTPWNWPLYPWSLFLLVAVCFGLRTYWLAQAFEWGAGASGSFSLYFIVPILLAVCVLLVELGNGKMSLHSRYEHVPRIRKLERGLRVTGMLLPFVALLFAFPASIHPLTPAAERLLLLLQEYGVSPAMLCSWLLANFYLYTLARHVKHAMWGVVASLVLAACVNENTWTWQSLHLIQPLALEFAAFVVFAKSYKENSTFKSVIGCLLLAVAQTARWGDGGTTVDTVYYGIHTLLIIVSVCAVVLNDWQAKWLRKSSLLWLPVAGWLAVIAYPIVFPNVPMSHHIVVVLCFIAISFAVWLRDPLPTHLTVIGVVSSALLTEGGKQSYLMLQDTVLARGLIWMLIGITVLLVGLIVSLAKAGALHGSWRTLCQFNLRLKSLANLQQP
jgi:hypothetical protein